MPATVPDASPDIEAAAAAFAATFRRDQLITDPAGLRTYECDGLSAFRVRPALVLLADSTEDVVAAVRICTTYGVCFVPRGAGTGLSGGALPQANGVVISTARMRKVLSIDPDNRRMTVQPGMANSAVSAAAESHGLYFAPDPSSQIVCSVGGNVAENSGGAHCLKYGFTTNHIHAITVVTPTGEVVRLGGSSADPVGPDLLGVFIGSEGTLGIVTEITVRLLVRPIAVRTLVADFATAEQAADAVSGLVSHGVIPAAVEMLDQLAISAVETATRAGYNRDAGAALVIELDGFDAAVGEEFTITERLCRDNHASNIRIAQSPAERDLIWKGRKSAFAAMGRISPAYLVQDGVIPRTKLAEVLTRIAELATAAGLRVANVFHAGDGNLHPLVLFDSDDAEETERAEQLSTAIAELCVTFGGSLSGEHGIGADKACSMPTMFSGDDLETMQRVRAAFDPAGLANPDKIFPTPRLCGERSGKYRPHPLELTGRIGRG
ncbi:glycolate oxidase [Microlunatus soli]|uniref:Glycolate oxidase n=1 Tax=Microlunatus soli TaxID=630515 RepID=A0A1H1XU82_9ACTN|nr:glycolate oxidase [Microlunatus soli]